MIFVFFLLLLKDFVLTTTSYAFMLLVVHLCSSHKKIKEKYLKPHVADLSSCVVQKSHWLQIVSTKLSFTVP